MQVRSATLSIIYFFSFLFLKKIIKIKMNYLEKSNLCYYLFIYLFIVCLFMFAYVCAINKIFAGNESKE